MEYHPFIDENTVIDAPRIILGSFPTWSIAKPNNLEKELKRKHSGDIFYFYGSSKNKFWQWYQAFVDKEISTKNENDLQRSLEHNNIGISDAVIKCKRKGTSASDSDLTCRTYFHDFFIIPNQGEKIKILCTSKGVLNEMFLNKLFFEKFPDMKVDSAVSTKIENKYIKNIGGNPEQINKPIFQVVKLTNGGTLECMALPSPGSPYRGLKHFGFHKGKAEVYLEKYLNYAFKWFMT